MFDTKDAQGCKDLFHQEMISNGILWGNQVYTTWAHKEKHLEKTQKAIRKSLNIVYAGLRENTIDMLLRGQRSQSIFKRNK